jgi:hypothetical protein
MEPDLADVAFHVEIETERGVSGVFGRRHGEDTEGRESTQQLQDSDAVATVLRKAPDLEDSIKELQNNVLAKGTMTNYAAGQRRFREFCGREGYPMERLEETVLIHYIGELNARRTSYATLCQTKAALVLEDEMRNGKSVAFTDRVDRYLDAAKRLAAQRREPVKKATEVNLEQLKRMVAKYITPHRRDIFKVNPFKFRTIYRLVIEYFTLCRLSDYRKLQAKHIRRVGLNMEITFPSSKNDQMHQGQVTALAANGTELCPVRLTALYFGRFGLQFGSEKGDSTYLHFRIRKTQGQWQADGRVPASSSKAREELHGLLRDMDMDTAGVTDKSFKMLGVTSMIENGAQSEEVALHGDGGLLTCRSDINIIPVSSKWPRLQKYRTEADYGRPTLVLFSE